MFTAMDSYSYKFRTEQRNIGSMLVKKHKNKIKNSDITRLGILCRNSRHYFENVFINRVVYGKKQDIRQIVVWRYV